MTLAEMSKQYEEAAKPLRKRLAELRHMLKLEEDPEEIWNIQRRIADLAPMLTQVNKLAELTAHYYEPGYYIGGKFTSTSPHYSHERSKINQRRKNNDY